MGKGRAALKVTDPHAAGSMANCGHYEVIVNDEPRNFGLLDPPGVDADGDVRIRERPGLGVEVDFDLLERETVRIHE